MIECRVNFYFVIAVKIEPTYTGITIRCGYPNLPIYHVVSDADFSFY